MSAALVDLINTELPTLKGLLTTAPLSTAGMGAAFILSALQGDALNLRKMLAMLTDEARREVAVLIAMPEKNRDLCALALASMVPHDPVAEAVVPTMKTLAKPCPCATASATATFSFSPS